MKIHFRLLGFTLFAAFVLECTGCLAPPISDPRIQLQGSLRRTMEVVGVDYAKAKDGSPAVQVTLHNRRGSSCRMEYTITWVMADGLDYATTFGAWTQKTCKGDETFSIQEQSPHADVQSFRLQIRPK